MAARSSLTVSTVSLPMLKTKRSSPLVPVAAIQNESFFRSSTASGARHVDPAIVRHEVSDFDRKPSGAKNSNPFRRTPIMDQCVRLAWSEAVLHPFGENIVDFDCRA